MLHLIGFLANSSNNIRTPGHLHCDRAGVNQLYMSRFRGAVEHADPSPS